MSFSALTHAGITDGDWYLGGEIGLASANPDSEKLSAHLSGKGHNASAAVDTSSLGARVFVGRNFADSILAVEVGYGFLGNFSVDVSTSGAVNQEALVDDVLDRQPRSGHSLDVVIAPTISITQKVSIKPYVGAFVSRQKMEIVINGTTRRENVDGSGRTFGTGAWWKVNDEFDIGANWQIYIDNAEAVNQFRLGVSWSSQ